MIHHRANRSDRQPVTDRLTQVNEQNRQALAAFLYLFERRRAADEQQEIRVLGPRDPNLLARDDVVVALANRHRLHLRRVGTGGRLAYTEGLQPQLTARNLRQVLSLL